MKTQMRALILILVITITPLKSFSSYESDLSNWLDSTLTAKQIDWNETEDDFFVLSKKLFKKNKSIDIILARIVQKLGWFTTEFKKVNKIYSSLEKLTLVSPKLLNDIEKKSFELVKTSDEWDNYNSATRLSLYFKAINSWGLNSYTPRDLSNALSKLNEYTEDKTLSKKLIIIILTQKILKQNNYVSRSVIAEKAYHEVNYYQSKKDSLGNDEVRGSENAGQAQIEPLFIGGSQGMTEFIINNICYPEYARQTGEQGIQYVQFVIEKDGSITNAVIRKGTSEMLSKEAIRLVEMMPVWKPGEENGKKVRCDFTIPIHFRLW